MTGRLTEKFSLASKLDSLVIEKDLFYGLRPQGARIPTRFGGALYIGLSFDKSQVGLFDGGAGYEYINVNPDEWHLGVVKFLRRLIFQEAMKDSVYFHEWMKEQDPRILILAKSGSLHCHYEGEEIKPYIEKIFDAL